MVNQLMVKLIWDEAYWLHRAEEARIIEDQIRNPGCKRIMRRDGAILRSLG
jgi:hypothetical protein